MLFPGFFLMIFGSESGCLGLENQAFGMRCVAKIHFRRSWMSHDSRVYFFYFGWLWDQFSWVWLSWRLALDLMTFHVYFEAPQILRPFWWKGTQCFLALDSKTLEAETWAPDPLDTWPQALWALRFRNQTCTTLEHWKSSGYLRSQAPKGAGDVVRLTNCIFFWFMAFHVISAYWILRDHQYGLRVHQYSLREHQYGCRGGNRYVKGGINLIGKAINLQMKPLISRKQY